MSALARLAPNLLNPMNNTPNEEEPPKSEEDLEDGEIEDDDEEAPSVEPPQEPPKPEVIVPTPVKIEKTNSNDKFERDRNRDRPDRSERRNRHEEKGKKHMTEAEKSILHLRKREEIQRKKWEKFNRNKDPTADPLDDDFAKNIEKTLATILNKKEKEAAAASGSEDKEKEEDKRGKKRRKSDKERSKNKQRRIELSPKSEIDENEMLNIRGGSPEKRHEEKMESPSLHSDESYDSEYSSDHSRSDERVRKRDGKKKRNREHGRDRNKNRDRDRRTEQQPLKDSQGVCVFYLQGKCQKNDCPYSHEAVPPMKLELCKFYLMDCCAKGDKCSYMHSEFPCKFYHTGLNCLQGDNCKFAHGKPLSEGLKQILFKHIETAPRDILGGFPRMSREEALNLINITQNKLQEQHGGELKEEPKGGIPSLFDINVPVPPELLQGSDDGKCQGKNEKSGRNRPSRWQDPDPLPLKDMSFPLKPFNYGQDQDMRIRNSNGDIDMRTLPPAIATLAQPVLPIPNITSSSATETNPSELDLEKYKREAGILNSPPKQDLDIRTAGSVWTATKDVDIRQQPLLATKDIDIRQISKIFDDKPASKTSDVDTEDEAMLQIDTGEDGNKQEMPSLPLDLPKTQRDLFLRIQAQQKETTVQSDTKEGFEIDDNINWYSEDDDEDDNRLTIKVDNEDVKEKEEPAEGMDTSDPMMSPPLIKPLDVVEKLGDLSKIDISAEVTKLLTSMSQARNQFPTTKETPELFPPLLASTVPAIDPRLTKQDPPRIVDKPEVSRPDPRLTVIDPRQRSRQSSTETQVKPEKLSIYEQGSIDRNAPDDIDTDFRSSVRSDVDLRNLQLPFKGMQNYTPATEIDASINSHLPMSWKVFTVEIPRPDYTGLKLSISDAEKTGDPRLRKIFRLSIEERDTPLSPKASPKASTTARVDPRLRKNEELKLELPGGPMSFNQQLNMLQSSAFYQTLTSNQKVLLNQELSQRNDSSNSHDPVLNSLLSNLNIIPGTTLPANPTLGTALSILANVSKLNLPQAQQSSIPVNPAILGQNPNLMNQMAQSIAQPGLLGAAPGIPNLPPDFPINFDPRNGGLLGNAPMPFGGFQPQDGPGNFNNFNDDFFPPDNGGGNFHNNQGNNRDNHNRGFNRDRRRGRNNFNRNSGGSRNFRNNRNNRSNRTHSPP